MSAPSDIEGISPDATTIVYVPKEGSPHVLTHGMYPQWVDANRFIYLKKDGLYMYALDTSASQKIWGTKGSTSINSMIDLSDDKTIIAWSSFEGATLSLFRVFDWGKPTITKLGSIEVQGTWPVISPDSSAVGILTEDSTPGAPNGIHVAIYDIRSLLPVSASIGLFDSDPLATTFTDWRP